MFDDRSEVTVSVLIGIVPGQQPYGDRTDGDFGTFNQDQMVRMLVRHAAPRRSMDCRQSAFHRHFRAVTAMSPCSSRNASVSRKPARCRTPDVSARIPARTTSGTCLDPTSTSSG
jgi:hypothetical protein